MLVKLLVIIILPFLIYFKCPKIKLNIQPKLTNKIFLPPNNVKVVSWNNAKQYLKDKFAGPESFTYNPNTGDIYTGTADGMIWKINKDLNNAHPIIRSGIDDPNCGSHDVEHICGRVLGLKYVNSERLIVADAYNGIIDINLQKLTKQVLVGPKHFPDKKAIIFNSVDVLKNETVYFTVSSMKWALRDVIYSLIENENTGGAYSYNIKTKELRNILSNLSFANGITLTHDETELIFCELMGRRLWKVNLLKENEKPTIFMDKLDGFPDNIKRDNSKYYYLALLMLESDTTKFVQRYPFISWFLPKWFLSAALGQKGHVYQIDNRGKIISIVNGTNDKIKFITEGHKIGDKLFLGNFMYPYFYVLHIN